MTWEPYLVLIALAVAFVLGRFTGEADLRANFFRRKGYAIKTDIEALGVKTRDAQRWLKEMGDA